MKIGNTSENDLKGKKKSAKVKVADSTQNIKSFRAVWLFQAKHLMWQMRSGLDAAFTRL